jgi:integrase
MNRRHHDVVELLRQFARARQFLVILDLHFHDLRPDGVSRLFEKGLSIPQVGSVSGHRAWSSLKRYTHLRQIEDKYADWKWLSVVIGVDLSGKTVPACSGERA